MVLVMFDGWCWVFLVYGYEYGFIGVVYFFLQNCLMFLILIIDDNVSVGIVLDVLFFLYDIDILQVQSLVEGLVLFELQLVDLVIQDMNFSEDIIFGEEGEVLFVQICVCYLDLLVILFIVWIYLSSVVDLVKVGVVDYLVKFWDDCKLLIMVNNLFELFEVCCELDWWCVCELWQCNVLEEKYKFCGVVFVDLVSECVIVFVCQVVCFELLVLIIGFNGVGKEKIVQIIQVNLLVVKGLFIMVNCGVLLLELIEVELFGVEVGVYIGVNKVCEGKFEVVDGGILFLDEIGNLLLGGQMKFLCVLEIGCFECFGFNCECQVKVCVVSVINVDLLVMICDGIFCEDLYYCFNMVELVLLLLVECLGDIVFLVECFLIVGKLFFSVVIVVL